ncbi:MAG: fumarylacetoacetate hydrolase family protein [Bacteroides sp.]
MKIICVGQNYKNDAGVQLQEPTLSLKPDSALLKGGKPFFIPDFASDFGFGVELVFHVCRLGKNISERFAHRYYDQVSLGLDLVSQDLLSKAKSEGLAWDLAKGFDGSAVLGDFISVADLNLDALRFRVAVNQTTVQRGNSSDMSWSIDQIIAYISQYYTLKIGDLIYTGAPEGLSQLAIGQQVEGYIEDKQVLNIDIR